MASIKQIGGQLEKSFAKWDYERAIKHSDNESKTRDYLIEPFFNLLGYNKMDHYSHEFSLKFSKGHVKKVDMVVTLNGKNPIMLVECKKATSTLTKKNYEQLEKYYDNHRESKIGILTNGLIYEFYTIKWNDEKKLSNEPFLVFDLNDYTRADLEDIAQFHIQLFDINKILANSDEKYFLNDFDIALTKTLYPPSDELIKLIFQNMGGKRISDKISKRITDLTNSISLENAIEKVKVIEGKQSSTGIYTTSLELKAYQIVKTILVINPKIKSHSDRIGFKDYKGKFKIIIDDMPFKKEICNFSFKQNNLEINIETETYPLAKVSTFEIVKHKKKLVDNTLRLL